MLAATAMLAVLAVLAATAAPAAAQPTPAAPQVIDGPSSAIGHPSGLGVSVARDGTGGIVYLKQSHVFVSRLIGGRFQAPQQVDSALAGASSQPVIAAGNGGVLLVGFVNGGALYVVDAGGASSPFGGPIGLAGGASNPSIQMTSFGKAYLAFAVSTAGGGHDVRAAYYAGGQWALESAPLNTVPGDDAGTGAGRPRVAAAGDGVAIVAWGERGHVITRRVWATSPSIVDEQADGPLPGCAELSADEPAVAAGGDSSYADVAFHERLACGSQTISRVLVNRLRASVYDGIAQPDGGAGAPDGADDPQVAMGEYGDGFVTSGRTASGDVYAMNLGDNGSYGAAFRVNGLPNAGPPFATPALAGLTSDLIAWQRTPGGFGLPEIRIRYSTSGGPLSPDIVVSSPAQGPTDAASGLAADGDVGGDAAVAWVQGTGASTEIVAAQLYQPPGPFGALQSLRYVRSAHPTLAWSPARAPWGAQYVVTVDGLRVAQSGGTSVRVPVALPDGPHVWQATAVNSAGLTSTARLARVFVDTVKPTARLAATGHRFAGRTIRLTIRYRDQPPQGEPARDASGVAKVVLKWGDRKVVKVRRGSHLALHAYKRPGRYRITLLVTDKAGNTTKLVLRLKIAAPKKKAPAPKGSKGPGAPEPTKAPNAPTAPNAPNRKHS